MAERYSEDRAAHDPDGAAPEGDPHRAHPETATEAPNGEGTTDARDAAGGGGPDDPGRGTLDHPVLDGSSEEYEEGRELNPRYGQDDPGLIRHPETGEKTPTPEGY